MSQWSSESGEKPNVAGSGESFACGAARPCWVELGESFACGVLARAGWESPSPAGWGVGLAVHWVFPQPAEPFACGEAEWGPA